MKFTTEQTTQKRKYRNSKNMYVHDGGLLTFNLLKKDFVKSKVPFTPAGQVLTSANEACTNSLSINVQVFLQFVRRR